jgi:hypothetical protein
MLPAGSMARAGPECDILQNVDMKAIPCQPAGRPLGSPKYHQIHSGGFLVLNLYEIAFRVC